MRANYQLRCRCSALAQSRYLCCPTPWFSAMAVAARAAFPCRCFPLFYGTCADAPHWEMAAELEPLMAEWLGPEEAEDAGGQATSLSKTEDLLETVKKLQKEGSLEPQIEDLIHRINELQQVNEEKGHLEEVLCKKKEALMLLQKHCQERESETQWLNAKEQLEDLTSQRKDLWEFHVLHHRLTQEISAMEGSKEQLLLERTLLRTQLQEVERRLQTAREAQKTPENCGLKTELNKCGGQSQSITETQNNRGEVRAHKCKCLRRTEEDIRHLELESQTVRSCLTWLLGTKVGSSQEQYTLLLTETSPWSPNPVLVSAFIRHHEH
ncbi:synaptonemal complex central element protein 1-like isoform X2 [Peromyscus eremicus]|uniref:synaptonemal complex central element protein 1-like isoform X2 n=1 Tax=Peromyscus eremicus TaxID=42410 RepID=UPI0027DB1E88|nr:synaptonemal complex central element protein 1-like isoform X2 [Peromyscus eremicus]